MNFFDSTRIKAISHFPTNKEIIENAPTFEEYAYKVLQTAKQYEDEELTEKLDKKGGVMNREKAIKMLQSGWEQTGYYTVDFDADKVADLFIKHERDTLKEFVEWLKQRYKGQGLVMTLDDISRLLDSELEDFIKNREKNEN